VYFDWQWLPPELRRLLGAEILLVAILVVAVCCWGAYSWRRMQRHRTTPRKVPRTKARKRR
jgi:TRAP-type C4-dicarboxylate transport system permease small subunit